MQTNIKIKQVICKLDYTSKLCSISAFIIAGALLLFAIFQDTKYSYLLLLGAGLILIPFLFSPRSISVNNSEIRIKMPLWSKSIALEDFHIADVNKFPLRKSLKILSSFGIGGYTCLFYHRSIGLYQGYFTDYRKVTVLKSKNKINNKRKYVVINNVNSLINNK